MLVTKRQATLSATCALLLGGSPSFAAVLDLAYPLPFTRKHVVLGRDRELRGTVRYLPPDHPDNQFRERIFLVSVVMPFLADRAESERQIKPFLPSSTDKHKFTPHSFTGLTVLPSGEGQVRFALDFVKRTDVKVPQVTASEEAIIGGVIAGIPGAMVGEVVGRKNGKGTAITLDRTSLANGSVEFTLTLSPVPVSSKDVAVLITYDYTKNCSGLGAHIKSCEREVDAAVSAANKPTCRGFDLPPVPVPTSSLLQSKFGYRQGQPSLELTYSLPGWRGALAPYLLALRGVPAPEATKDDSADAESREKEVCSRKPEKK